MVLICVDNKKKNYVPSLVLTRFLYRTEVFFICIFKTQAGLLLYLWVIYTSLMAGLKNVIEKPAWGEGAAVCVYAVRA